MGQAFLRKLKKIKRKRGKKNIMEKGRLPLTPSSVMFLPDGPDFVDYSTIRDVNMKSNKEKRSL